MSDTLTPMQSAIYGPVRGYINTLSEKIGDDGLDVIRLFHPMHVRAMRIVDPAAAAAEEVARQRAIRAVLGVQWASMVVVRAAANPVDRYEDAQWWDSRAWHMLRWIVLAPNDAAWPEVERMVIALPTAEQIVDGTA